MSKNTAIRTDNLSKQYHIGTRQAPYRTIRETLVETVRTPFRRMGSLLRGHAYGAADMHETIWALEDVSFEVEPGEVIGIIGRNGAGKSTLLKILSRITEPTAGLAEIRGRVGSLLEVGTGFHPELTGRENIFLNGAILGMRKREMARRFDEIVAFAEVEKFIDTPVKFYSSGMYVRLAFAVAAYLEPEILLIDEVLAVGDVAFQKKCLGKMSDVAEGGRTVLFVSHNMAAVSALCSRTILLEKGRIAYSGETEGAILAYLDNVMDKADSSIKDRVDRKGSGLVRINDVWIENDKGERLASVSCGEEISINISYSMKKEYRSLHFLVGIYNDHNQRVLAFDSETGPDIPDSYPLEGTAICKLPWAFPLVPGQYRLNIAVFAGGDMADYLATALGIQVVEGNFFGAGKFPQVMPMFFVPNEWHIV